MPFKKTLDTGSSSDNVAKEAQKRPPSYPTKNTTKKKNTMIPKQWCLGQ